MKISAPNDEDQTSIESAESSRETVNAGTNDDGGIDFGEFVADTIELVSSFFDD